jgi:hypothetical protein
VKSIEIAEGVGLGRISAQAARQPLGVNVAEWGAKRPDWRAERTGAGAAIYALTCACCSTPQEAATAALLAARESLFAAAGDACDLAGAEALVDELIQSGANESFQRIARCIFRDVDRMSAFVATHGVGTRMNPVAFGPLWDDD